MQLAHERRRIVLDKTTYAAAGCQWRKGTMAFNGNLSKPPFMTEMKTSSMQ
jgi:hypothetical protein